jgi:hypothetical protein
MPAFIIFLQHSFAGTANSYLHILCRYYCSKSCQTADWKVHKRQHDNLTSDIDRGTAVHHSEARDVNGVTVLISKAADGDWRAVKKLLAAGADSTLSDNEGFTALHHAAFYGHLAVVNALLADTMPRFRLQSLLFSGDPRCYCRQIASQNGQLEVV